MKQKIDEETLIATRHLINIEEMGVLEDCSSEIRVEELWGGDRVSDGIPLVQKSPLKDSGTRDVFSTGAVRDADDTKGRMDLVPMDLIGEILEFDAKTTSDEYCDKSEVARMVFDSLEESVWHQDTKLAMAAFIDFGRYAFGSLEEAILQLSIHFRDGAAKYSERNWQKLIPLHRFIDSAGRHMIKWYRGDQDERHDRSLLWNLICYIWTVRHANIQNKEICDLPWCEELRKNEPEIC